MEVAELIASTVVMEEWGSTSCARRPGMRSRRASGRRQWTCWNWRTAFRDNREEHPELLVELNRAVWLLEPRIAARHLPDLVTAARNGRLPAPVLLDLIQMLIWFQQLDDAKPVALGAGSGCG